MEQKELQKWVEEFGSVQIEIRQLKILSDMKEASRGESLVLYCLAQYDRDVNPKELSDRLGVSTARVAAILKKLEMKQLIERRQDPDNHRQTLVHLLEEGYLQQQEIRQEFESNVAEFLQMFGPEDAAQYLRIRRRILDHYRKKDEGQ